MGVATVLQIVGCALIVAAALMIFIPLGLALAGIACVLFGLASER